MSSGIRIHPENRETIAAFLKMLDEPDQDRPIVEMNDETARDIKIIWDSINDLATRWRGRKEMHVPKDPIDRKEYWGVFAADQNHEPTPVAKQFVDASNGEGKVAIDLGCGNSPHVPLLLRKGWKVIAVDSSRGALGYLIRDNKEFHDSGQLQVVEADLTLFTPQEPVDLVIASDVLPYIDPAQFRATWNKIHDYIKLGGVFIGTLFRSVKSQELRDWTNITKERGGWLLPDRRMVRPLLSQAGYEITTCAFRKDLPVPEQPCIQFVAKRNR